MADRAKGKPYSTHKLQAHLWYWLPPTNQVGMLVAEVCNESTINLDSLTSLIHHIHPRSQTLILRGASIVLGVCVMETGDVLG